MTSTSTPFVIPIRSNSNPTSQLLPNSEVEKASEEPGPSIADGQDLPSGSLVTRPRSAVRANSSSGFKCYYYFFISLECLIIVPEF